MTGLHTKKIPCHADHRYEEALKSMFENRYI